MILNWQLSRGKDFYQRRQEKIFAKTKKKKKGNRDKILEFSRICQKLSTGVI